MNIYAQHIYWKEYQKRENLVQDLSSVLASLIGDLCVTIENVYIMETVWFLKLKVVYLCSLNRNNSNAIKVRNYKSKLEQMLDDCSYTF